MFSLRRITPQDLQRRRWELLALTSIGAFMSPLDSAILSVAFPSMSPALRLTFAGSLWIQAAYLVAMVVLLIPLGRLADHHGRVRFYLLGLAVFTLGSLLAALSMNAAWMIASRVVQGTGAALLVSTSAAIVTAAFPPHERGRALGINVMAVYLGLSLGPPLGGLLVDTLGWRWIFLVNLPIGLVSLVWGWMLLPRGEEEHAGRRPDLVGALFLAVFLMGLLVPLTFIGEWGWGTRTLAFFAVALAGLAVFILRERSSPAPLLDLDLLRRNRLFAAANLAALLNYLAVGAIGVLTAVFLEVVLGQSAMTTGWLMLSQPLIMAVLSPLSGRLSDRVGSRALSTSGMLIVGAGMGVLAALGSESSVAQVALGLGIVGLGIAAFSAPNSSAVMGSVRRDQLSLASAFLGTMRVTGMALSFAVLGGVAASQLGVLGGRLLFSEAASGGLAGAGVVEGFVTGYRYAMLIGVGLVLIGAVASLARGAYEAG
jgi:EmrB/QacA subfamily drug resistance transporter